MTRDVTVVDKGRGVFEVTLGSLEQGIVAEEARKATPTPASVIRRMVESRLNEYLVQQDQRGDAARGVAYRQLTPEQQAQVNAALNI